MFRYLPLLALITSPALADLRLEYQDKESGGVASIATMKNGKAHFAIPSEGPETVVFDTKAQTITVIDPSDKSYFTADKNTINNAMGGLGGALAEAMKQLENLPPEQLSLIHI